MGSVFRQNVDRLVACGLFFGGSAIVGAFMCTYTANANCFDFSKAPGAARLIPPSTLSWIDEPLRPDSPIRWHRQAYVKAATGDSSENINHGLVKAELPRSVPSLIEALKDHNNLKSPKATIVETVEVSEPSRWIKNIRFEVNPFPFVYVRWQERWGFFAREMPSADHAKPQKMWLINYEKVDGTSHISHLCGSIELVSLAEADRSEITYYEQVRATNRTAQDTLAGLRGTVETLLKVTKP